MVPDSRTEDFQNFPMWRQHVVLFAKNIVQQFGKDLIIPMTLVNPEYVEEIHKSLKEDKTNFFHFFLNINETILRKRITEQVMVASDPQRDQEIRQWRLDQVSRCLAAIPKLPKDTVFLNSGTSSPDELLQKVLCTVERK